MPDPKLCKPRAILEKFNVKLAEEKKLNSKNYQLKLTKAIHSGIKDYFYQNPPRGTLIAQDIMSPNRELKHVIIRGDTLSEIAQYYNVSLVSIKLFW